MTEIREKILCITLHIRIHIKSTCTSGERLHVHVILRSYHYIDIEDPALLSWDNTQTVPVESGVVAVGLGQHVG